MILNSPTMSEIPHCTQNGRNSDFERRRPVNDNWRYSRTSLCRVALRRECSNGFAFGGVYVEQKIQPSDAQHFSNSRVQHGQLDLRIPLASRYQDRTKRTNSSTVNTSHLSHLQDDLPGGVEGLPCGSHEFNRLRPIRQPPAAAQYRDVVVSSD